MAKTRRTKRSRFEGIDLNTLNKEAAKVTGKNSEKNPTTEVEALASEPSKEEKTIHKEIAEQASKKTLLTTEVPTTIKEKESIPEKKETEEKTPVKRGKGRPKSSSRQPLNTAIEPRNRQRLEFLAMLNGGSVADQLNDILERYFTNVEKVDELIEIFEARKKKRK